MKRSNFVTGVLYALVGIVALIVALYTETKLDGILFGLAGAGIAPGVWMICRHIHWQKPDNRARYQEQSEHEIIETQDELNVILRDKAGRKAYRLGILVTSVSMMIFAILDSLELMVNAQTIVVYLGAYLVLEILADVLFLKQQLKKYE